MPLMAGSHSRRTARGSAGAGRAAYASRKRIGAGVIQIPSLIERRQEGGSHVRIFRMPCKRPLRSNEHGMILVERIAGRAAARQDYRAERGNPRRQRERSISLPVSSKRLTNPAVYNRPLSRVAVPCTVRRRAAFLAARVPC